MWGLVGITALAGLAVALVVHLAFWTLAGTFGSQRAIAYPALLTVAASVLAWQGLVRAVWLPAVVGAVLLVSAAIGLARIGQHRFGTLSPVEWVAVFALTIGVVYAAFPDYRPDQWNNDLILAKITAEGPLRTPIFDEHAYYGGSYQYLLTLFRRLWGNDVFNHCAADAFTWLILAFGLGGLFRRLRGDVLPRLPAPILLTAWALFALPEQSATMNAKPDPLVLLAALAVLALSIGPSAADDRRVHGFLLGFMLLGPLALKLTWVHFAAACGLGWLTLELAGRRLPRPATGPFLVGAAAGLGAVAPYVLTNLKFFGNPLHPAQVGPLRSTYWSETIASFHDTATGRAHSLSAYADVLANLPTMLSWHLFWLLLPMLLVLAAALTQRILRAPRLTEQRAAHVGAERASALRRASLTAGIFYILLWPLFFDAVVFPRWYYAGVSIALALCLLVLERASAVPRPNDLARERWQPVFAAGALLLPFLGNGELSNKVGFVARFAGAPTERLFEEASPQWRMARDLLAVNRHRRVHSPAASFYARATLIETESTYFLDGVAHRISSRDFDWLTARLAAGGERCQLRLLAQLDVAYLVARISFNSWPGPYRSLAARLPALDPDGRVRYVDPRLLTEAMATDPACSPPPKPGSGYSSRLPGS